MDYSALTTSLSESKLDMGAAALCATDERKEVMNFTDVYCDSGQVVMVNQTNDEGIKSVDDLKGKKVSFVSLYKSCNCLKFNFNISLASFSCFSVSILSNIFIISS